MSNAKKGKKDEVQDKNVNQEQDLTEIEARIESTKPKIEFNAAGKYVISEANLDQNLEYSSDIAK